MTSQGSSNQNHNEIHTCQNDYHQKEHKCWQECRHKKAFVHCWWECKFVWPLWRTAWRVLKKLKIELLYKPVIPLLGIYPPPKKKKKTTNWKIEAHQCSNSIISNFQDEEAT